MQALRIIGGANYIQQIFIEQVPCARNCARTVLDTELGRTDTIPNLKCQMSDYKCMSVMIGKTRGTIQQGDMT